MAACAHTRVQVEGQPWCNSHYTRQVWVWAAVLTRQGWDAASQTLRLVWQSQAAVDGEEEGGEGVPVIITSALLHWFPRAQKLVCAAGRMRVRRVSVEVYLADQGAGASPSTDGHTHTHTTHRSPSTECTGRWDVMAGGVLALDTCRLELDGPLPRIN